MSLIHSNTPIEKYCVGSRTVFVKREDRCVCAPSFSKLRGVEAHLKNRTESVVGVLDTFHSKAGWGTALICQHLHKKCVVFYPVYRNNPGLRVYQKKAKELGADIVGIDAGRSCILYHYAQQLLKSKYTDTYMMPNALKLIETVQETAEEVQTVPSRFFTDCTWVVSVSSGTIAAGVIEGLALRGARADVRVILHEGYTRPAPAVLKYVFSYGKTEVPFDVSIVDEGYDYKDAVAYQCHFPCNPYYDRKAWRWLNLHIQEIKTKNVLFWNIGA